MLRFNQVITPFLLRLRILVTITIVITSSTPCFADAELPKNGLKFNGNYLKVVAKYDNLPVLKEPYAFSEILMRASRFHFFYVFPTERVSKKTITGYYKVGKTPYDKDIIGWVHEDDIFEWGTREAIRYTATDNRPPARIYATEKKLSKTITTGNPYLYYPVSEEFEDTSSKHYHVLIPVSQKKNRLLNKRLYTFYEITYLHSGSFESAYLPSESFSMEESPKKTGAIDIVYALDTTRSMRGHLDDLKRIISTLPKKIIALPQAKTVNTGIVEYRDYPTFFPKEGLDSREFKKTLQFLTKHTLLLTDDPESIRAALQDIKAADYSSVEFEEAFFDGIWAAIEQSKWQGSALKLIINFSDSGGHSKKSPKNPYKYGHRKILKEAIKKKVTFITIKLPNNVPGIKIKKEQKQHKRMMKKIAKGRRGKSKGIYIEVVSLREESEAIKQKIIGLIETLLKKVKKTKDRRRKSSSEQDILSLILKKGGTKEALLFLIQGKTETAEESNEDEDNEDGVEPEQEDAEIEYERTLVVHNVSPFLHEEKVENVELAKGWLVEKQEEYQYVTSHTLLAREELKGIVFFLKTAEIYAKVPSKENWKKAQQVLHRRIGRTMLKSDPLKKIVEEVIGTPLLSELLSFTFFDLLALKSKPRRTLGRKIKTFRKTLETYLDDENVWIQITDRYFIGYIPSHLLP